MEKQLGFIRHFFVIAILLLVHPGFLKAASWSPIIPLNVTSAIPLAPESLRDPEIARQALTDDLYAQRAIEEKTAMESELATAKAQRRIELLGDLYRHHAILVAFYEDLMSGRLQVQGNYGQVEGELQKTRHSLQNYAIEFARTTGDKKAQAHAFYHAAVAQYLSGNSVSIALLTRAQAKMSRPLQARMSYLIALSQGQRIDRKQLAQLQASLRSLSPAGRISAQLFIARLEAARNQASYKNRLAQAVRESRTFSGSDRERIAGYALGVWIGKERSRAQWAQAPISFKQNSDLEISKAVAERSVLQSTTKAQYAPAIRFYQAMIDQSRGTTRLVPLVDRMLDLEAAQYASQRSPAAYEKALVKSQQMLSREGILGAGHDDEAKSALGRVRQRHRTLVAQLIQTSKQPSASPTSRLASIRVAQNYLNGFASEDDKIPLRTNIAQLYVLNKQHAQAVEIYLALKADSQGADAQKFLLLAMRSQRVLAQWPDAAPWQGVPRGQADARTQLASMYEERLAASQNWDDRAHLGLLYLNLGNGEKSFKMWTDGLQKDPQHPQAQYASGMMLATYKQARQWQNLEDLSRIAIKLRLVPRFRNEALNPVVLLADALFEGGKEHFANSRFAESSKKLAEFTRLYKADPRRPEGLFVLGKSYHMDRKHPLSVETMYALVNEYPKSAFDHDALLLGGSWSKPMAWEDQTIFFYQRFADRYDRDPKAPGVRMTLVDLYMGRELYGNAVRAHSAQANDPQVAREDQIKSALAVMHIEERYGEAKQALIGANKAKELSGNNPLVVAEVLAFDARQAAAANDLNKIKAIEAQLASIGLNDRSVIEALALTRYILAEKLGELNKQEIFNLEQTDPYLTLNTQYAIFLKTKEAYEKVCAPGPSSYCGLGMMRLSETTRDSLKSIENLTIAQTLDAASVRKFERQKLAIIATISQTSARADSVALGISESGETLPEWSQEIVVNSSEGSLTRSHGAIGNGYVQWLPVKAAP